MTINLLLTVEAPDGLKPERVRDAVAGYLVGMMFRNDQIEYRTCVIVDEKRETIDPEPEEDYEL